MVAPVLPPDVPIVGSSKVQPSWWRWFREVNAGINDVTDLIAASQATVLADVALTAGANTIAHGLGATPSTWWAARPRGAFTTASSAVGEYPHISPDKSSASQVTASSLVAVHTMQFTPDEGSHLVAVMGIESMTGSIASVSQAGVSWTRLAGPLDGGSSNISELWIGEVGPSPSPVITLGVGGFSSSAVTSVTIAQLSEISSTTPTAIETYKRPDQNFPNRHVDSSVNFATPPVPNAGDIVITVVHANAIDMPAFAGWECIAACRTSSTAYGDTIILARVAQSAVHQAYRGIGDSFSSSYAMYQACMPSTLAKDNVSLMVPHGLREVSLDATNLVVDSISDVTVDFLFR